QNTNPMVVAPEQRLVRQGFARDDLFVCVHEQFMTETAKMADIVLPATMFLEHDDVYKGGGHQHILFGPKLIEAPGQCRSNHFVICELAQRLGAEHPGFALSARELIDGMLQASGWGTLAAIEAAGGSIDCQPDFETAHYRKGFAYPDGRFRFKPDWPNVAYAHNGPMGPIGDMPSLPDHWPVIEEASEAYPFRLAVSPARNFLNTSFNNTPTSLAKEGRPSLMVHPLDAAGLGFGEDDIVRVENARGSVRLHVRLFDGLVRGVVIAEGIWPPAAHLDGEGINVLTGADQAAPFGGAAFHDNRVRVPKAP
ncbi:MAG: molybdopterin-dependent oxidoreductase, partial [Hyphomicrobiales bacterium]|nr:molybdopterin-dependent oxidoreductase [Hyphomicrobiales bacterium]